MSVLIKGMKIPQSCYDCDMLELSGVVGCGHAYATNNSEWGRALNCPLIELPDHGDLIDRDELIGEMKHSFGEETIVTFTINMKGFKSTIKTWPGEPTFEQQCNLTEFVRHSPVVIPAERSEE